MTTPSQLEMLRNRMQRQSCWFWIQFSGTDFENHRIVATNQQHQETAES
jgi:hypothetical protein